MKPLVARIVRLGVTGLILVMLVLFARKVNWHDIWRTMQYGQCFGIVRAQVAEPQPFGPQLGKGQKIEGGIR